MQPRGAIPETGCDYASGSCVVGNPDGIAESSMPAGYSVSHSRNGDMGSRTEAGLRMLNFPEPDFYPGIASFRLQVSEFEWPVRVFPSDLKFSSHFFHAGALLLSF